MHQGVSMHVKMIANSMTMLVGMEVPYEGQTVPSLKELDSWSAIQTEFGKVTEGAYTVDQALAVVRHPAWRWPAHLYQHAGSKTDIYG